MPSNCAQTGFNPWAYRDVMETLHEYIGNADAAAARCSCKDLKGVLDSTLTKLRPSLMCSGILQRFPALKHLDLTQICQVSSDDLSCLAQLTQLTQLKLGGPASLPICSSSLAIVSQLTNLQSLSLRGSPKVCTTAQPSCSLSQE
eukprot:jgi/Chrzof1/5319/Cz15g21300.t1